MRTLCPASLPTAFIRRRLAARVFVVAGAGTTVGVTACSKTQPSLDSPQKTIWREVGFPAVTGAVSIHYGLPGVFFGPMGLPGSADRPRYAILVKYPASDLTIGGHGWGEGAGRNGARTDINSHFFVVIDRKPFDLRYAEEIDVASRHILSESPMLNNAPVNLAAGNLLLVDLSRIGAPLQQVSIGMPHEAHEVDPNALLRTPPVSSVN